MGGDAQTPNGHLTPNGHCIWVDAPAAHSHSNTAGRPADRTGGGFALFCFARAGCDGFGGPEGQGFGGGEGQGGGGGEGQGGGGGERPQERQQQPRGQSPEQEPGPDHPGPWLQAEGAGSSPWLGGAGAEGAGRAGAGGGLEAQGGAGPAVLCGGECTAYSCTPYGESLLQL